MTHFKYDSRGMTLIELLGVIVIIGILFVILVFSINAAQNSAKTSGALTDLRSMQSNVEYFQKSTSKLPTAKQLSERGDFTFGTDYKPNDFDESSLTPVDASAEYKVGDTTYVSFSKEKDPWGNPYLFVREQPTDPNEHERIMLASSGADGKLQSDPFSDPGDDVVLIIYNN